MIHDVKSSVTGTIWMVSASEGQQVFEGNDLMTVESMKMEVPVQSPCDGTVTWIKPVGESINVDEVIARVDDGK